MNFLLVLLISAAACHGASIARQEFEKELSKTLNLEEFEADKKIMAAEVQEEADERKEEIQELLAALPPIPAELAESERLDEEVNAEIAEDLFEGDMILTTAQLEAIMGGNETESRDKRQADTPPKYPANIWGTTPIPFSFAPGVTEDIKKFVREGTAFWQKNTCANFVENGAGKDSILVVDGIGCSSAVGKNGGKQLLTLNSTGCSSFATVTHELEHALGVYHEQSREDRDNYVYINFNNVRSGMGYNFDKRKPGTSQSFGVPYEFGSNMHYTQDSFAKSYQSPTILAQPAYTEYQSSMGGNMPSFLDILLVNRFYKCDEKCKRYANFCKNGGYLNVRTCNTCVCPEGWGGRDCSSKPDGCVVELTATKNFQSKSITLGDYGKKYSTMQNCVHIINAPSGRIEVKVDGIWGSLTTGCGNNGIEFKPKRDLAPRGLRYCGEWPKTSIWSETNRFPMLLWTQSGGIRADIQFRYV